MERTRIRGAWLAALAALGFVIPACNEGDVADYMSWTKAVAAEHDGRSGDVDVCHSRGWYEDGVCDTFCAAPDPDCRDPETACMADEECGAARFCDTSACLSCCPDAPPGTACIAACCGVCRDRTSDYDACMADEDCAAGEACDTSECLSCCPDAPPGTDCIAACCGRCTAAECTSDAECDAGAEW